MVVFHLAVPRLQTDRFFRGDGFVFLHGSAVAGRGGTVTRALAVTDAHSGPAVAECVGVMRHEDASRRSDLGGAKDKEKGG